MTPKQRNSKLKPVLIAGFSAILIILSLVAGMALYHTRIAAEQLNEIASEQRESRLIFEMRDSAHQRALVLHRMAAMTDPFERDNEYMEFKALTERFLVAKEAFQAGRLAQKESARWELAKKYISIGSQSQSTAIELILADQSDAASEYLRREVVPNQKRVMTELTSLLDAQRQQIDATVAQAAADTERVRVALTGLASFIGLLIAIFVIRSISRSEDDLVQAREAAQAANQQKSLFLANMSHEIRTPLTAIIGFAQCLQDDSSKPTQRKDMTDAIVRNGKHLLKLINDVLDLSKIESNKLEVEQLDVDPFQVLGEVDSLIGQLARDKGLEFKFEHNFPLPKRIRTDPTRMKQILLNLTGNAVKFTSSGNITLTTRFDPQRELLTIVISDTGIGMTQEQAAHLFQAFSQADASTTRKYGGTGLGLSISKTLAQLLGGDVVCDSAPGAGSRFTVTLATGNVAPEALAQSQETAAPINSEAACAAVKGIRLQGRILLAEDSPDIQQLVRLYVERCGAEITVVGNGQLAVEAALVDSFDLILMDMQMPIMDGIEATKLLRDTGYGLPIVALSANAMQEEQERYMAAGINGFLAKPIELGPFFQTLSRFLKPAPTLADTAETILEDLGSLTSDPEYQRMVEQFKAGVPDMLTKILNGLEIGDAETVRIAAHTLKGMGGSFGYPRITELAKEVETCAKQGALDGARLAATALAQFCESSLKAA